MRYVVNEYSEGIKTRFSSPSDVVEFLNNRLDIAATDVVVLKEHENVVLTRKTAHEFIELQAQWLPQFWQCFLPYFLGHSSLIFSLTNFFPTMSSKRKTPLSEVRSMYDTFETVKVQIETRGSNCDLFAELQRKSQIPNSNSMVLIREKDKRLDIIFQGRIPMWWD